MKLLNDIKESLFHLAFPHICEGCGTDILHREHLLCIKCNSALPKTDFHLFKNNPVEQIFWGRLPIKFASAQYYFTKESLMQQLVYQVKYRRNKNLGRYLGKLMGQQLIKSDHFQDVDCIIPLPLFPEKEKKRGFNQSLIIAEGIAEVWQKPILKNNVVRIADTESQTKKNRIERWQNMEGRFEVRNESKLERRHILLIDDIITTGATLEACGRTLLDGNDSQLSIATLCFSSH